MLRVPRARQTPSRSPGVRCVCRKVWLEPPLPLENELGLLQARASFLSSLTVKLTVVLPGTFVAAPACGRVKPRGPPCPVWWSRCAPLGVVWFGSPPWHLSRAAPGYLGNFTPAGVCTYDLSALQYKSAEMPSNRPPPLFGVRTPSKPTM